MKKKYIFIIAFLTAFQAQCQFFEDFESGTPPNGWATYRSNTNNVPMIREWQPNNSTPFTTIAGTSSAFIDRENTGINTTAEYWLITPMITIGNEAELLFWGSQTLLGDQGSHYEVWLTNGSKTDYTNYSKIATWNEVEFSMNIGTQKAVPLQAYAGQQVYIAFVRRHTQPASSTSGDRWMIDNVQVTNSTLGTDSYDFDDFSVYPNPTKDFWHFDIQNKTIESIGISDMTGKTIFSATPKTETFSVDASAFESGVYFAKVTTANGIKTLRLIKK